MALVMPDPDAPEFTRRDTNLADSRLGAEAIVASDEFFAPRQRLLAPSEPVFIAGKYDTHGKWMDGWESRRKRGPGNDWCIVRLARPGTLSGVDIDTRHFTGNYPPAASLEACYCTTGSALEAQAWTLLLPSVALQGNAHHYHCIDSSQTWSHLRLSIYPDGGVARLRAYGRPSTETLLLAAEVDLAAALNGARIVAANNQHFGLAANLLLPGRGADMGDGWETRRRREPGNDWCIVALAAPGIITRVEVDTAHFKGNFPDACSLQAAALEGGAEHAIVSQSMFWPELLAPHKLRADAEHSFTALAPLGALTHVRLNIYPDGGISRLRLFGHLATP